MSGYALLSGGSRWLPREADRAVAGLVTKVTRVPGIQALGTVD